MGQLAGSKPRKQPETATLGFGVILLVFKWRRPNLPPTVRGSTFSKEFRLELLYPPLGENHSCSYRQRSLKRLKTCSSIIMVLPFPKSFHDHYMHECTILELLRGLQLQAQGSLSVICIADTASCVFKQEYSYRKSFPSVTQFFTITVIGINGFEFRCSDVKKSGKYQNEW